MSRSSSTGTGAVPPSGGSARARWIAGVFLLALIVRVAYLVMVVGLDGSILTQFDDDQYHTMAESIASGHGQMLGAEPTATKCPGYPFFLAACYAAFGANPGPPRLVQAVLGAGTAALLVALALELGLGLVAAALAGMIAALYPSAVYLTGRYFPTVLVTFLLAVTVLTFTRWGKRGDSTNLLAAAAALGAAALVRAEMLLLAPLLAAMAFRLRGWRRQTLVAAFVLAGCTAVMYAPWVVRNLIVFRQLILSTSTAAHVCWAGNNPWARGGYVLDTDLLARYAGTTTTQELTPIQLEQLVVLRGTRAWPPDMTDSQADRVYQGLIERWRSSCPTAYWLNMLNKLVVFANPWPSQAGPVLWRYRYVLLLSSGLVMPLALVGFLAARRRGPGRWVVLMVLLQTLATTLVTFGHARLRFPAEMLFIPYAAFGAVWLAARLARMPTLAD